MRTLNIIFVFGLIACSFAIESTFNQQYSTNNQFKEQVDTLRSGSDIGEVIMSMAELHMGTEAGRFAALFDAIHNLKAFLNKQLANENKDYARATAQHARDVLRLSNVRDNSRRLINALTVRLNNKLYPARKQLIKNINAYDRLLGQLRLYRKNLIAFRKAEVALYNARLSDFNNGLAAIAKALPLLNGLLNVKSFAEVDQDVFSQVATELKDTLNKLPYAQLHTAVVETLVSLFSNQNFVNQAALRKVIALVKGLQARLQAGRVRLQNNEAANARRYRNFLNLLNNAIKRVKAALAFYRANLARVQVAIANARRARRVQRAINARAIRSLRRVHAYFRQRTADHKQLVNQIASELAIIAKAKQVLAAGGITRNS